MRILTPCFFLLFCLHNLTAQVTLVRSAPNDTIKIAETTVLDMALVKGQQSIPINLSKPVAKNLLHWRYFDEISNETVITDIEPVWAKGVQLLEDIPNTEMLSLHINLETKDSIGQTYRIFLLLAGISKQMITSLPAELIYDHDIDMPQRFAAIVQVILADGTKETYECMEGTCSLDRFDPQKKSVRGYFEFTGNRIGIFKKRYFENGVFIQ